MKDRLRYLLNITLFWLLLFIFNRVVFSIVHLNSENNLSIVEFIRSMAYGLRLDISLTAYFLFFGILFFAFAWFTKFSGKAINILHYALIPIVIIVLFVDMVIFSFWGTHFESSAFIYADRLDVVTMSLKGWQFALAMAALLIYIFAGFYLYQLIVKRRSSVNAPQKFYFIPVWLFLAATMIIPIRGGLQHIPLNTGAVYYSKNSFANYAAVNPVWNFAYSMKRFNKLSQTFTYMPDEEAKKLFDGLYTSEGQSTKVLKNDRPNVVIIMLESFSYGVVEHEVDGKQVCPNLNALKNEGLFFNHIYATNTRSDKGIAGILSAYPVLPGISIIKYPQKSSTLPVIPNTLSDNGYKDLSYYYGGDINFANMNSFVHIAGFEKIISKADFSTDLYNKKWGVHDEHVFNALFEDLNSSTYPTFKTFFTLSSHEPFDVPMDREFKNDYLNSVHYTDRCIGDFINKAKAESWWENSLFIFIADHGSNWPNLGNDNAERYHIPMVWIGGALSVSDSIVNKIGSQTDLSVTLLSQLNIEHTDFKFGKDLLDSTQNGFAFFNHNDGFSFVDDHQKQYYDLIYKDFYEFSGVKTRSDSLISKAYIQTMYNDYKHR